VPDWHCREAALSLCLGTSLLITPSCNLPLKTVRAGGKMAIVNLQKTPKDKKAFAVIRAKADEVMAAVMSALMQPVPRYVRTDRLLVAARLGNATAAAARFSLELRSAHGKKCPVPWLKSASVTFPDACPPLKPHSTEKLPLVVKRQAPGGAAKCRVLIHLQLVEHCTLRETTIEHTIDLTSSAEEEMERLLELESTCVDYPIHPTVAVLSTSPGAGCLGEDHSVKPPRDGTGAAAAGDASHAGDASRHQSSCTPRGAIALVGTSGRKNAATKGEADGRGGGCGLPEMLVVRGCSGDDASGTNNNGSDDAGSSLCRTSEAMGNSSSNGQDQLPNKRRRKGRQYSSVVSSET